VREKTYFKSPKIAQILRNVIPLFVVCGGLSTLSPLPSHSQSPPAATAASKAAIETQAKSVFARLPLRFERNEGQADPQVKFVSRGAAYSLYLTPTETILALSRYEQDKSASKLPQGPVSLHLRLVGANPSPRVVGIEEFPGKSNYFVGNDPKKWQTNVPNYARVKYEQVYPGVDLEYYGNQGGLEYDFFLAPGADPQAIQFEVAGEPSAPPSLHVASNGDLLVKVKEEEVRINKSVAYQPDALLFKVRVHNTSRRKGKFQHASSSRLAITSCLNLDPMTTPNVWSSIRRSHTRPTLAARIPLPGIQSRCTQIL